MPPRRVNALDTPWGEADVRAAQVLERVYIEDVDAQAERGGAAAGRADQG